MADTNFNYTYGQLQGPFSLGIDLYSQIEEELSEGYLLKKIGILSQQDHYVTLNNEQIQIGKTGIYESEDVIITSIVFNQNEDENARVTYMLVPNV